MPYSKKRETATDINWLASQHFQTFTEYADKSYNAGDVFKKDGKAIGLVFDDVTVDDGDGQQPMSVMVEGYVVEDRLPNKIEDADKTAMSEIKFR